VGSKVAHQQGCLLPSAPGGANCLDASFDANPAGAFFQGMQTALLVGLMSVLSTHSALLQLP
jgi:hypothetical protein